MTKKSKEVPEEVAKFETFSDLEQGKKIKSVFLNHKSFAEPKSFPKDQAIRMLKNQKKQKGFKNDYTIDSVVRGR